MNLLMLAVTASPVNELATILFCGTTDQPTPICCQAARDARNQMDKRGRAIIDRYLARNCDKEKDRRPSAATKFALIKPRRAQRAGGLYRACGRSRP